MPAVLAAASAVLTETLTVAVVLAARLPLVGEKVSQDGPETVQLSVPLPEFWTV